MHHTKIAIIGAGNVGATIAYTLMIKNLAAELVLIDVNEKKEAGEVMDLEDGLSFVETGAVVRGNYPDARDADIIIITAGRAQQPKETRLALAKSNKAIMSAIMKGLGKVQKDAIILVVANPVDVLTYHAQELSHLPHSQIFGTGTALDTARLQYRLAHALGVSSHDIHGFVLGEHGDSEFVPWSTVTVGGRPMKEISAIPHRLWEKITVGIRREAYEIIRRKGATYYGIAMTAADIVEAVIYDQHQIFAVTSRLHVWNGVSNICLGAPAVIGRKGIERLWPLRLNRQEKKLLLASAKIVQSYVRA